MTNLAAEHMGNTDGFFKELHKKLNDVRIEVRSCIF